MKEKIFKTIGGCAALNMAVGIAAILAGTACGVLLIISAAKLIGAKSKMIF